MDSSYLRKYWPANLLRKGNKFKWTKECQIAFDRVKEMLSTEQVLYAPDFNKSLKLPVDANGMGIGLILLQRDNQKCFPPGRYFSRKLNQHQRAYSVIEKESLALIESLKHFEIYLSSTADQVVVYSDHNPLTFLHRMKNKNRRILSGSLLLQEFNIKIKHTTGKFNVSADALSRA